jgi:hypothetical protein
MPETRPCTGEAEEKEDHKRNEAAQPDILGQRVALALRPFQPVRTGARLLWRLLRRLLPSELCSAIGAESRVVRVR